MRSHEESIEGVGNGHCEGPRTTAQLIQFKMCVWRPAWQEGRAGGEGDAVEVKEIYTKCRTTAPEHTPGTMPFSTWSLSPDHSPRHHVMQEEAGEG